MPRDDFCRGVWYFIGYMERTLIGELGKHVGETVSISGWVDVRRDQGKMVFFDFRDRSGLVQGVVLPGSLAMDIAKDIRNEYVVRAEGIVNKRPEKNAQADRQNGDIELEVKALEILNPSDALPFDISNDTSGIDESVRAEYRYLDLRSTRMQKNMKVRSEFIRRCREYLFSHDFTKSKRHSSPNQRPKVRVISSYRHVSTRESFTRFRSHLSSTNSFS